MRGAAAALAFGFEPWECRWDSKEESKASLLSLQADTIEWSWNVQRRLSERGATLSHKSLRDTFV